jgi:hypothetical protein
MVVTELIPLCASEIVVLRVGRGAGTMCVLCVDVESVCAVVPNTRHRALPAGTRSSARVVVNAPFDDSIVRHTSDTLQEPEPDVFG